MISCGIVVHGGAGSSESLAGACAAICRKAFVMLRKGSPALEAAVEAVRVLEDDGRFNAGSGSTLRLDGKTVEMDAGVMDCRGRIGAVMALRNARNPVLVARALMETPHVALAGEGATLFARRMGLDPSPPISADVYKRFVKTRQLVKENKLQQRDVRWKSSDIRRLWNFEVPYDDTFPSDTVGAVALDRSGDTAVASSTGGASPMMLGRVGDTAMIGSGFYAGPKGAVAATGIGEEIIRRMLAKTVYDLIGAGKEITAACEQGVTLFSSKIAVGLVAISAEGYAIKANRQMAAYGLVEKG
jgi:L-asparaginase/beta-aspartyl-peptidase (threonine type)